MEIVEQYNKSYSEYKAELDAELTKSAESFVKIGYLLKVARDTNILSESGYESVTDFAKAEYGIDKTQVSRFIHINDKFSEGGYSDQLRVEFKGFGYAKLTIMLQLPDGINEGLSPEYSKAEIQAIKDEVDAERQISDIECMLEAPPAKEKDNIEKVIYQLGSEEPGLYVEIAKLIRNIYPPFNESHIRQLQELMAPQGEKTYSVRVPGEGRMMLMLTDKADCRTVNTRSGDTDTFGWDKVFYAWYTIADTIEEPERAWSALYCMPYPVEEKQEVAPVQQKTEIQKSTKPAEKRESKVQKSTASASKPVKTVPKTAANVPKSAETVPETKETVQVEESAAVLEAGEEILRGEVEPAEASETEEKELNSKLILKQVENVENAMRGIRKGIDMKDKRFMGNYVGVAKTYIKALEESING